MPSWALANISKVWVALPHSPAMAIFQIHPFVLKKPSSVAESCWVPFRIHQSLAGSAAAIDFILSANIAPRRTPHNGSSFLTWHFSGDIFDEMQPCTGIPATLSTSTVVVVSWNGVSMIWAAGMVSKIGLPRIIWRKGWDSNPRYPCRYAGFQDRCLKPLGHPSDR